MVEGGDHGKIMLPAFLGSYHYEHDTNPSPQFHLFGDRTGPGGFVINPLNHMANEQASVGRRSSKRVREEDPQPKLLKVPMSLNTNSFLDEGGSGASFLNPKRVSTGLRLACEEEERNSVTSAGVINLKTELNAVFPFAGGLEAEFERQRAEFDHYLKVQEENIFKALRELNNKHTVSLLNTVGKRINEKIREKDLEIVNNNRKNIDLEERIKQVSAEAQSWHYKAKYGESVINTLKSNIQLLMARGATQSREGCGESEVDDVASYANVPDFMGGHGDLLAKQNFSCKACSLKEVSILLLPCRHLCLCNDCAGLVDLCPVCQVMKTASVQVYMSI